MRRLLLSLLAVLCAAPALAHPLSRDKWSLRSALQVDGDHVDAVVVLEVPFDVVTKDLKADMDAARNGDDPARAAQAVLDAYTKSQWDRLGSRLTLTVDGKAPKGAWKPRENRLNGKGAVTGGFFMYIVEFVPETPIALDADVTFVLDNQGYTDVPMVYSSMLIPGDGWALKSSSVDGRFPDRPYDLNSPDFWLDDPALRRLEARFVRTP